LPVLASANNPASDALIPASLPAATWHFTAPGGGGRKPDKKKFKAYPIGYFHIDIAEVQTAEGKLYLFVAIDRASKFAIVQLHRRATKMIAAAKKVLAWQLSEETRRKKFTKMRMAELMETSRAQLDRVLDPMSGNTTLETLQRAAKIVGRELRVELV
jgi:hypothetical protein